MMKRFKSIILILMIIMFGICLLPKDSFANVVIKVIAINPSKDQTQRVPLKAFLPKEIKPENIVDKGDLEIAYDTQQGSFFIFGEYDLKPGESIERTIEIEDIWTIPQTELDSLRSESKKLSDLLKNTEFSDRIAFLHNNIDSELNRLSESQKNSPVNPEQHISGYRENLKTLESIKTDLALARSLLAQAKPMPTLFVWKLILSIIIFLALLGGSFYLIWHKQLKSIAQDNTFFIPKGDESVPGLDSKLKTHEAEPESKPGGQDIDKILDKG